MTSFLSRIQILCVKRVAPNRYQRERERGERGEEETREDGEGRGRERGEGRGEGEKGRGRVRDKKVETNLSAASHGERRHHNGYDEEDLLYVPPLHNTRTKYSLLLFFPSLFFLQIYHNYPHPR